ncbi:MAG: transcription-repair coupling factor [Acholeplasmatales bacterium]|jgi:transcription-repair coupling factor (superfamily II helicase)|nr:transcription-repair coupling factor [Acholeplasmatales bacterium]
MSIFHHPIFQHHFFTSTFATTDLNYLSAWLLTTYAKENKTIFVVCNNITTSTKLYDILMNTNLAENVLFFPGDSPLTRLMSIPSIEFKSERLFTLRSLLEDKNYLVICDYYSYHQLELSKEDYQNSIFKLKVAQSYPISKIIKLLEYNGYQRVYTVEKKEDYALRGSILDIFSINIANPVRLDFFGERIESIKEFNVQTQRSLHNIEQLEIVPTTETFYTNEMKTRAIQKIKDFFANDFLSSEEQSKLNQDLENLENRLNLDTLTIYLSFFHNTPTTIKDFKENSLTVYLDLNSIKDNIVEDQINIAAFNQRYHGHSLSRLPITQVLKINESDITLENRFALEGLKEGINEFIKLVNNYPHYTYLLGIKDPINIDCLKESLNKFGLLYYQDDFHLKAINIINENFSFNLFLPSEKLVIYNETKLFFTRSTNKIKYRSILTQSTKIHNINEISVGDYVVHYNYGIARYLGIVTKKVSYVKCDYIELEYKNEQRIFVPIDKLEFILKYNSFEDSQPKLTDLQSKSWSKTKTHIKQKIKEIASKLLKMYAIRAANKRKPYLEDDDNQLRLEADFPYEETPDQLEAIKQTKADMLKDTWMDRLIVGDVGFGKTEVALRAAYKAVLSGRQVAYLVPTTILARQHYLYFKSRLEKYGVIVGMFSRFVDNKESNILLNKVHSGYIDIIIGTHRLLSENLVWRNLGLLVIDEEQRFGVTQKMKINNLRSGVDTLSLSATPIPRTLQMAMLGIKDFSIIDTPPTNRYPIQTYVVQREDGIISEAIKRELSRGGQVFYLYNNIQKMDLIVSKLNKLVPQAQIAAIHAKMDKALIEETLSRFINNEYNVLVSTTIIETGIDIPNSNTLIIHDATRLGLSQLYQLRGRVGRSDKIAYAYIFYDHEALLTKLMKDRLAAISKFSALGSGYKIAKRDLAIRGAGDILGSEQSGFIDSVGIELYLKLVQDSIKGIDSDQELSKYTKKDGLNIHGHYIDENYINNDDVRLEIHRKIMAISQLKDATNIIEELVDRFGKITSNMENYIYEVLFQKTIYKLGKSNFFEEKNTFSFTLYDYKNIDLEKFFEVANQYPEQITISRDNLYIKVSFNLNKLKNHHFLEASKFIEKYLN